MYAPYTETWATMVTRMLRANYEYSDITMVNSALAGTDTAWGVDDANLVPRVINQNPDLVIIAFGMNDGNRPLEDYRNKIQGMITKVRGANPDAEILLVSSMLPNTEVSWLATGNQGLYQNELVALQAANEGVGVARVTDAFRTLVAAKDYYDLSGNNVNHPNDFVVRLYAQIVLDALDGKINNSVLADLIARAEALDESSYTADSWADLVAALTRAKKVVNLQDQALIDAEVTAMQTAIAALKMVDRLTLDHLLAYYNFEDKDAVGKDLTENKNHLVDGTGFWGDSVTLAPSGAPLGGSSARFLGASFLTAETWASNQPDFLDREDAYTVSFFFKMAKGSRGGALFSNKNWAEEGVQVIAHTWEDPTAVGQVEIYLDYAYRDQNGNMKNFHQVVYFMPEAAGGGIDTRWHHIALSVSKQRGVRFFFDGQEKDTAAGEAVSEYLVDCQRYAVAWH